LLETVPAQGIQGGAVLLDAVLEGIPEKRHLALRVGGLPDEAGGAESRVEQPPERGPARRDERVDPALEQRLVERVAALQRPDVETSRRFAR